VRVNQKRLRDEGKNYGWTCPNVGCGEDCLATKKAVDEILRDGYLAPSLYCPHCDERLLFVESSHPGGGG
jgi:hypothetical protein